MTGREPAIDAKARHRVVAGREPEVDYRVTLLT
jgi:hypothetical protein